MHMTVKHELRRLEADLGLYPQEVLQAGVRAINRTMTTVRAAGATEMGKVLPGLKAGAIKGQMKIERATRAKPIASITFTEKRFRLFGNWIQNQTKKGVRLGVRVPWRIETLDGEEVKPEVLRHAFIQRPRGGGAPNVWIRIAGAKRYPITALLASSLSSAFVQKRIGHALVMLGHERFTVAFGQEARYVTLQKLRRGLGIG